jgi:hypothetical protein
VCKFQYNDFAIKTQEGGLPDFFQDRVTPMTPACKKVLADAEKK